MKFNFPVTIASLSIFCTLFSLHGFAKTGGSYGGGGNVVACENEPAVVLDYYNAVLPDLNEFKKNIKHEIIDISNLTEEETIQKVSEQLGSMLKFRIYLKKAIETIGPIDSCPHS